MWTPWKEVRALLHDIRELRRRQAQSLAEAIRCLDRLVELQECQIDLRQQHLEALQQAHASRQDQRL